MLIDTEDGSLDYETSPVANCLFAEITCIY